MVGSKREVYIARLCFIWVVNERAVRQVRVDSPVVVGGGGGGGFVADAVASAWIYLST